MNNASSKRTSWVGVMLNCLFALAFASAFGASVTMLAAFPDHVLRFHHEPESVSGMTLVLWRIAPHSVIGLLGAPLVFWTVFCWASVHLPDGVPVQFSIGLLMLAGSLWLGAEQIYLHSHLLAIAPEYFQGSRITSDVMLMIILFLEAGSHHSSWKKWKSEPE